ncbi:hypothetical protein [Streptomyces sp. NPDC048191]|uniref:hypothetical protein n=1 Tax=Streptomyces sp. NPDC048191 TaxID=3155484 RepID=UPI0033C4F4EB
MTVQTAEPEAQQPEDTVMGLRLFTRGAVGPRWLVHAVVPAARELRQAHGASVVYLRRGWLHGPHVDLVARTDRGAPLPWDRLAGRLDAGPLDPSSALTEEAYLDQAREFGRLERVPPPYLPMREHGTVERLRPADTAPWPHALNALREVALGRLHLPLLDTLEDIAEHSGHAEDRVLEIFVALAAAHHAGLPYGVFSLRSHAEAFLSWASARKDPRPAFRSRLEADAPRVRKLVEAALAGEANRTYAAWQTAFAYTMGVFDHAVLTHELTLERLEGLGGGFDAATMGPPGQHTATGGPSDFHRAMDASGVIADPPEWFASYRLLVNLLYQQLPLLGVSPLHRYYVCYAVAETVDDVLGEPWHERVNRMGGRP